LIHGELQLVRRGRIQSGGPDGGRNEARDRVERGGHGGEMQRIHRKHPARRKRSGGRWDGTMKNSPRLNCNVGARRMGLCVALRGTNGLSAHRSSSLMQILESNENGVAVLAVEGRMDTNTSPEAEKAITRQIEGGAQRILLDLAGLEYMSSAGQRVLPLGVKKTTAAGATLSLSGVRKEVQ